MISDSFDPVFPSTSGPSGIPADPEALFGELPRSRSAVGALWSHQADQLRTYARDHRDSPDVALELPTGSGKTLVGLLIGEWRRREKAGRVVYACPTTQLVRQVTTSASVQGIDVRNLSGRHTEWDDRDIVAYTRGAAVAITTYSHVFNGYSKFPDADTLIFDDAHAAEQYVAEAWAVAIPRSHSAYSDLFDALEGSLDAGFRSRMVATGSDAASNREVRLIPLSVVFEAVSELDSVLASSLDGDASWRFAMIRSNLASCMFYVARSGWYIRPMIPPTYAHAPFIDPSQRVYLSATLGEAGELERAFGRSGIARVPVPPVWERTGSGRRFFVFPQLARFEVSTDTVHGVATQPDLLQRLHNLTTKTLVLSPSAGSANVLADHLEIPPADRYRANVAGAVEKFLSADKGALIAPSRYDGMDLADDSCRLMYMVGTPEMSHLQDQFLTYKLRAGSALAERIRTRLIQGVGRCTRGPDDWAVVVMLGQDLVRYFANSDNTTPMPVELQAEIEFGLAASEGGYTNVVAIAQSALAQDKNWRDRGETGLADRRRKAVRTPSPFAAELRGTAKHEVKAWNAAWAEDWDAAAEAATQVIESLTSQATRPYRALWAYLASSWFRESNQPSASQRALELLRVAHAAAGPNTWLRDVAPLPIEDSKSHPADAAAILNINDLLGGPFKSSSKFLARSEEMLAALAQTEAKRYERGLVELGTLLGAQSFKPDGIGRTDAAWVWDELWLTVEAKSEQTADLLSMDYVRKANTHLDSLSSDLGLPIPSDSLTTIVGTTDDVHPDAVAIASPRLYLMLTDQMLDIARDARRAWVRLRSTVGGLAGDATRQTIAKILGEHNVLPSQVRERLSESPIRG